MFSNGQKIKTKPCPSREFLSTIFSHQGFSQIFVLWTAELMYNEDIKRAQSISTGSGGATSEVKNFDHGDYLYY